MKQIDRLFELKNKEYVVIDEIPVVFQKDFLSFIAGHTIDLYLGKIRVGATLYKKWLAKLKETGFDDEIPLNNE